MPSNLVNKKYLQPPLSVRNAHFHRGYIPFGPRLHKLRHQEELDREKSEFEPVAQGNTHTTVPCPHCMLRLLNICMTICQDKSSLAVSGVTATITQRNEKFAITLTKTNKKVAFLLDIGPFSIIAGSMPGCIK